MCQLDRSAPFLRVSSCLHELETGVTFCAPPRARTGGSRGGAAWVLRWRVRGLDRVALHADLTILATLACALTRARAGPLAA